MQINNIDNFQLNPAQKQALHKLLPDGVTGRIINRFESNHPADPEVMVFTVHITQPPLGLAVIKLIRLDSSTPPEVINNRLVRERLKTLPGRQPHRCEIPAVIDDACDSSGRYWAILYQLAGDEHTEIFTLDEALRLDHPVANPAPYLNSVADFFLGNPAWYNLPPAEENLQSKPVYNLLCETVNWLGKNRIDGLDSRGKRIESIKDRLHFHDSQQPGSLFRSAAVVHNPRLVFFNQLHPNPIAYIYNQNLWPTDNNQIHIWPTGLCHGDFHCRNLICSGVNQHVYIIDWAMMDQNQLAFYDHSYLELNILLNLWLEELADSSFSSAARLRLWEEWSQLIRYITGFEDQLQEHHTLARYAGSRITPLKEARQTLVRAMQDYAYGMENDIWKACHIAGLAVALNFIRKNTMRVLEQTLILYYGALHLEKLLDKMGHNWRTGQTAQVNPWLFNIEQPVTLPAGPASCLPGAGPVREQACLVGRQRELSQIQQRITNESGQSIVVLGERRLGKTSLLAVAKQQFGRYGYQFVDIDHAYDWPDFSRKVQNAVLPPHETIRDAGPDELKRLCRPHLTAKRVVCIDELDVMFANARDEYLFTHAMQFIAWLQEATAAALFITMTDLTRQTRQWHPLNPNPRFFFNPETIHRARSLPPLTSEDVDTMCKWYFPDRSFAADTAQLLYRHTWGHPFFLQMIFKYLPDNLPDRVLVDASPVIRAINESLSENAPETEIALKKVLTEHFTASERYNFWRWAQGDGPILLPNLRHEADKTDAAQLAQRGYLQENNQGYNLQPCWRAWLRNRPAHEFPAPTAGTQSPDYALYVHLISPAHIIAVLNEKSLDFGPAGWLIRLLCQQGVHKTVSFEAIAHARWGESAPLTPARLAEINQAFDYIQSILEANQVDSADYIDSVMNQGLQLKAKVVCQHVLPQR